jgi:excinuclease ABC subunit C
VLNPTPIALIALRTNGAKRHQALLRRFGGLREPTKAPIEEIAKTQGISLELAERIYQHFD